MRDQPVQKLRVAKDTIASYLATTIVKFLEEGNNVVLECIGCMPIMQASKAVAVANSRVASHGFFLCMLPAFQVVRFPDKETKETVERTAIWFTVIKRSLTE